MLKLREVSGIYQREGGWVAKMRDGVESDEEDVVEGETYVSGQGAGGRIQQ